MYENGTMHDSLLKAGEGILVRVTSCNVKSQTKNFLKAGEGILVRVTSCNVKSQTKNFLGSLQKI